MTQLRNSFYTKKMTRAGLILIDDQNKIALIERNRAEKHYFVIPGGQIEDGETSEDAAIREAWEELGLIIQIDRLVSIVKFENEIQYYYLVRDFSGVFGSGSGPEMIGKYPSDHGTYKAEWLPVQDMLHFTILPQPLSNLILKFGKSHWPALPIDLDEVST